MAGSNTPYSAPELSAPEELPSMGMIGADAQSAAALPPAPQPKPLPSARKPLPVADLEPVSGPVLRVTVPNIDHARQGAVSNAPAIDMQQAHSGNGALPSLAPMMGDSSLPSSQGGLVKALISTFDATQAAVVAAVPVQAMPLQAQAPAPVPVNQPQQAAVLPLPADAPNVPGLKQVRENGEIKTVYNSPGIIVKKEVVVAPTPPDVQRPAATLTEHLINYVPQAARETIEQAQRTVTVYADANASTYSNMAPAAGVEPSSASPDAPLIELPTPDQPVAQQPVVAVMPAAPAAVSPAVTASATGSTYVAVPLADKQPVAAAAPVAAAPAQEYIAVPLAPNQIANSTPTATTDIIPPAPVIAGSAAPQGYVPPAPNVAQDSIVPTGPAAAVVELYGEQSGQPIVPTPPARELSAESRAILDKLPGNIEKKNRSGTQILSIDRATPTPPINSSTTVAKHEAMGINIEVKAEKINVNEELRKAYDAQQLGQSSTAIQLYRNVLDNAPDNKQAMLGLAIAYHRSGQADKARALYGKVLAIDPRNREALNNFMLLLAEEAPDEALSQLQSLENRNPDSSSIPAQMAVIYQRLNKPDLAMEKMLRAMEISPENLTYRYNLAILLDRQKRYEEAAQLYQHLLQAQDRGEIIPGNAQKIQQRLTFIRSNKS